MAESFLSMLTLIALLCGDPEPQQAENPWPAKPVPRSEAYLLTGQLYSAELIQLEQAIQDAEQFLSEPRSASPAELEDLRAALIFAQQIRRVEYFGRGEDGTTTGVSAELESILRLYNERQFLLALRKLKSYASGRKPDRVVAVLYQGLCEQQLAIDYPSPEDRVKRLKKALAHFANIGAHYKERYVVHSELVQARALLEKYQIHRSLANHYKKLIRKNPRVHGNGVNVRANQRGMQDCRAKLMRQFGDEKDTNGNLFTSLLGG